MNLVYQSDMIFTVTNLPTEGLSWVRDRELCSLITEEVGPGI